jgi:hypothetical protein
VRITFASPETTHKVPKGYLLRRPAYIDRVSITYLLERLFSLSVPTLVIFRDVDSCRRHAVTHPSRLAKGTVINKVIIQVVWERGGDGQGKGPRGRSTWKGKTGNVQSSTE